MSAGEKPKVFLERRGYRRRRMMDALRLLPVLGILLWLFPLFWPTGPAQIDGPAPMKMSVAVTYVFVVWVFLIVLAFGLWFAVRSSLKSDKDSEAALPSDEAGQ